MIETQTHEPQNGAADSPEVQRLREEVARLSRQNLELRNEVARLGGERHDLHRALDAYVARASSRSMFGPLELTAGTCVGPRRRRNAPRREPRA